MAPPPSTADRSDLALLTSLIRDIRTFPSPGIQFKDITPLLADGNTSRIAVDHLAGLHGVAPMEPD